MKMPPITPRRLLDRVGFRIGNAAAALNALELLQELLLVDSTRRRIDRGRLLCRHRIAKHREPKERQDCNGVAKFGAERRHAASSSFSLRLPVVVRRSPQHHPIATGYEVTVSR